MLTKETVTQILSAYQAVTAANTPHTAAVLLLLIYDTQDQISIVITKRPDSLETYAGDYCLPGGMTDPEDTNLLTTAEREIFEELSLARTDYQIIGQLDDAQDRFGNLVRPFVGIISQADFEAKAKHSVAEVDEIYYLSLTKLSKIAPDPALAKLTGRSPMYSFSEGKVFIWGLTARILVQFHHVLIK